MCSMRPRVVTLGVVVAVLLGACTAGSDGTGADVPERLRTPTAAVDVVDVATPASAALGVSRRLFASADVVVVAADDPAAQRLAAEAATTLGAPMFLPGPAVADEVARLGARTVLAVGTDLEVPGVRRVEATPAEVDAAVEGLPRETAVPRDVVVLTRAPGPNLAAVTTARSAGATVLAAPSADPRAEARVAEVLRQRPDAAVIGLGRPFRHGLAYQVMAVREGLEQPGGGLLALPGRHVVALYGHPGTPALGLLGEQGVSATVARAERVADRYRALTDEPVVAALEVIATVASASKGRDGDYSAETDVEELLPLVRAAGRAGQYVVLDLQPGRTDFLTQAKRYRSLLALPHVGLALDPEWRLRRDQRHLRQIGSVSASEVNETSAWLARLTRQERLPQKLFVVHQFASGMVRDRDALVTSHPELATVIHVDGQGTPAAKRGTWATIRRGAPVGVHWGWKNFHDEDEPMLTARQTWRVEPRPDLVTYQ